MDGAKKLRVMTVRMTGSQYAKIKSCAEREGVSISSLVANVMVDYADRDIDMARQMMASQTRLHSDVRGLKDAVTLTYNLLYSFIYTFFVGFAKQCMHEFATEEHTDDKNLLANGIVHRKNADRMMKLFNEKFMSQDAVRRAVLANIAEMTNSESENKKEEA